MSRRQHCSNHGLMVGDWIPVTIDLSVTHHHRHRQQLVFSLSTGVGRRREREKEFHFLRLLLPSWMASESRESWVPPAGYCISKNLILVKYRWFSRGVPKKIWIFSNNNNDRKGTQTTTCTLLVVRRTKGDDWINLDRSISTHAWCQYGFRRTTGTGPSHFAS